MNSFKENGSELFLYFIGVTFSGVIAWQIFTGVIPSALAIGYLAGVIAYAVNSHGVKQGVDTTNSTVAKTAIAQQPLNAAQEARTASNEVTIADTSARLNALESKKEPPASS